MPPVTMSTLARKERWSISVNVSIVVSRMSAVSAGTSDSSRIENGGSTYDWSRPWIAAARATWLCTWYDSFVSGSGTSLPNRFSATRRSRYSYWKKRRSPLRRSAPCELAEGMTSNGANWTTAGSSFDWSTITLAASFSTTAQVSTSEKGSPARTAPALVRHQH